MTTFILPFADKFLTGHFGKIRTIKGKKTQPHRGTDWAPKLGTPIPAVSNGTVMLVQYSKVLGWVVVQSVKGYDGKVMYVGYCHMDTEPAYKVGKKLKVGEIIGKVGNEGFSSGAHLHATLSDTVKGVFAGSVFDLYKYLSDQIKNAPKANVAGQKSSETKKKETKVAKPAICPSCGQEVKK